MSDFVKKAIPRDFLKIEGRYEEEATHILAEHQRYRFSDNTETRPVQSWAEFFKMDNNPDISFGGESFLIMKLELKEKDYDNPPHPTPVAHATTYPEAVALVSLLSEGEEENCSYWAEKIPTMAVKNPQVYTQYTLSADRDGKIICIIKNCSGMPYSNDHCESGLSTKPGYCHYLIRAGTVETCKKILADELQKQEAS